MEYSNYHAHANSNDQIQITVEKYLSWLVKCLWGDFARINNKDLDSLRQHDAYQMSSDFLDMNCLSLILEFGRDSFKKIYCFCIQAIILAGEDDDSVSECLLFAFKKFMCLLLACIRRSVIVWLRHVLFEAGTKRCFVNEISSWFWIFLN